MHAAVSIDRVLDVLTDNLKSHVGENGNIAGIVFARPTVEFAETEIIPHIPHWNNRSGKSIDFFFAGYGEEGAEGFPKKNLRKIKIGDRTWIFSETLYSEFLNVVGKRLNFSPSGGIDLILVRAVLDGLTMKAEFEPDQWASIDLETSTRRNSITSARHLFERIFSKARSGDQSAFNNLRSFLNAQEF